MTKLGNQMHGAIAELIRRGAEIAGPHDEDELQAFAKQLRGFGDTIYTSEALALLSPDLRVPECFFHVRFTIYEVIGTKPNGEHILAEPRSSGGVTKGVLETIELQTLLGWALTIVMSEDATSMGPGRWLQSFALPVKTRGVMELAMVLEPCEINDGSFIARVQAIRNRLRSQDAKRAVTSKDPDV